MSWLEIIYHFLVKRMLNHDPNERPEATAIFDITFLSSQRVWSIFWPSSHQAISYLSTYLGSLDQARGNKTICNIIGKEL